MITRGGGGSQQKAIGDFKRKLAGVAVSQGTMIQDVSSALRSAGLNVGTPPISNGFTVAKGMRNTIIVHYASADRNAAQREIQKAVRAINTHGRMRYNVDSRTSPGSLILTVAE
jgi:hypothetical protein